MLLANRCFATNDITKSKMFSEMGEDSGDYVIVGDVRQRKAASLHLQVTKET